MLIIITYQLNGVACVTWEMHENREYEIMTGKDSLFFGDRVETGLTQTSWGSCG